MATGITEVLNEWAGFGVFDYLIPFLLIFAVVYGILAKTKLFDDNKGVNAIVSIAIGLLALQFDFVSTFYANIFPRFGVGLAVFLVLIIFIGFFLGREHHGKMKWVGYVVGIGVALWALTSWNHWGDEFGIGFWLREYFWSLIILAGVIGLIVWAVLSGSGDNPKPKGG